MRQHIVLHRLASTNDQWGLNAKSNARRLAVKSGQRILLDKPDGRASAGDSVTSRVPSPLSSNRAEPRFAIGIFGGWGSGKTTLMKAVRAASSKRQSGRRGLQRLGGLSGSPQLLVPLLDSVRAALIRWSEPREP